MSLYASLSRPGPSGFGYGSTAEEVSAGLDLSGQRFLLTGCNSGLGRETLRVLALRGATVLATARSREKATEACAAVGGGCVPLACELEDPASVAACVAAVREPLDGIIANAGIMALPRLELVHGLERQFYTNHIGHFQLVTGLLDRLGPQGRVVILSSAAHTGAPREGIQFDNLDGAQGYSAFRNYGQSKLANLLFARELARRFAGSGRVANAVHPGVIDTNLGRHMNPLAVAGLALARPLLLKSIPQGAATQVWAAVHPAAGAHNGEYFSHCNVAESSALGKDEALARRLWERSEEILARVVGT